MASRSDIEAGAAYVRLYTKNSELLKGLDQMKAGLRSVGVEIASMGQWFLKLGAMILAPMGAAIAMFERTGSALKDMSQRTGVAAQALGEIGHAADLTGGSLEAVEAAIRKMQKEVSGKSDAFGKIGLSITKLRAMKPGEQFMEVAKALSLIENPTRRAAMAQEVWGKSGTQLLPMLDGGIDGLKRMRSEYIALGGSTNEEIDAADEFGDKLTRLRALAGNAASSFAAQLVPAAEDFMEASTGAIKIIQDWIRKNGELVRSVAKTATMLLMIGAGAIGFSKVIGVVNFALGFLKNILSPVVAVSGLFHAVLDRIAKAAIGAAAEIRKLGTVIAGIGATAGGHLGRIALGLGQITFGLAQIGTSIASALVSATARGIIALGPTIARGARSAASGLVSVFAFHASQIGQMFGPLGNLIASKLAPAWNAIAPKFRKAFLEVYLAGSMIADRLRPTFTAIVNFGTNAIRQIASAWRTYAPIIANYITTSMRTAFNTVRAIGSSVAAALARGGGNIGRGVSGVAAGASGLLGMMGSGSVGVLGQVAMAVPSLLLMGSSITALINPATLLIAAVAGGVYAWTQFSDTGRAALASLMTAIEPFIEIGKTVVGGLVDAFKAGDLQLAGKIALKGLEMVFAQFAVSIGGSWGDTFGTMGEQIRNGDMSGAWNTVLKEMYAGVMEFTEGVTALFIQGAKSATEVWRGATTSIANGLLDMSASGGVMGAAASMILGVDMKQQDIEKERLRMAGIESARKHQLQYAEYARQAEANGGTLAIGAETYTTDELRRKEQEYGATRDKLMGVTSSASEDAKADNSAKFKQQADSFAARLDAMQKEVMDASIAARNEASKATAGGASKAAESLAKLSEELKKLRGEADIAAAKAAMPPEISDAEYFALFGDKGTDVRAPDLAQMKSGGSFSAAGLVAMGQGGGTDALVGKMDEVKKVVIDWKTIGTTIVTTLKELKDAWTMR